jgi:DNA-directed RNA polymerase specialized sigma24 family protein
VRVKCEFVDNLPTCVVEDEAGVRPKAAKPLSDDQDLRKAVGELFAACQLRVGRYLAQMVDDRGFHDALRSRAQLPEVRNPEAWLYGIARNRTLQALPIMERKSP